MVGHSTINQIVNQKNIKNNSTTKTSTTTTTNLPFTTQILKPEILESLHKSEYFPRSRHRWNTNEEIAALLISIDQHDKWLTDEVKLR
uniref:Calmodulin-binding transcription activator 2-like n=1 Tax=Dermatophagoides pteronyssinus TaxID=6956 RepID=A0A6P6YKC8_DERPT|nr:calmodulin-binding transcription activator 2-like [Dermatophagoides pteronyssinus]